jgi:hypothetical protein
MRKFVLIAAVVFVATIGVASVGYTQGIPEAPYCGHANTYTDGGYGWEGYLGHGDYANYLGGTTHWHLYELWWWDSYWGWYFWDYEWKQC